MKSYNAIFNEDHDPKDATEIEPENLPDFDLLVAGFPCQAFSVAGERRGFEDTRGTLFFEIARIAREKLPKVLLLENVKGLLNHSNGETFRKILETLDELGYDVQWQVLNSKYHGVPQNRERVFIVAHRRGESWPEVFPFREPDQRTSRESKERGVNSLGNINPSGNGMNGNVYEISESTVSPTITTNKGEGHKMLDLSSVGELDYVGAISDKTWLEEDSDKSRGHHEGNRVYSITGISPTLAKNKGGASGNSQVILDWHGHKNKSPVLRSDVATLRAESHGHQPKLLQKSHDWRENQKLREFTEYSPTIRSQMGDNLPLWKMADERGKVRVHRDDEKKSEIQGYSLFLPNANYVDVVDNHDKNIVESEWKSGLYHSRGFEYKNHSEFSHAVKGGGGGSSKTFVTNEVRIRKLTPRECWRLQGFPDWSFERAQEENSDTQLYKQAGNSVTVNVIEDIAERLVKYYD